MPERAAAAPPRCSFGVVMRALGDPTGTEVSIALVPRRVGCVAPKALRQVRVFARGKPVRAFARLGVTDSESRFVLPALPRRARVIVRAVAAKSAVRASTRVRRRPDLVVRLKAPTSARSGVQFLVDAEIVEQGRDTGATARLTVTNGATVLSTTSVDVRAGGRTRVSLPVTLNTSATLVARVDGALPREFDSTNDEASATVRLVEFQLNPARVLAPSFAGYGAQFNHHVYAAVSRGFGVTDENVVQMESEVVGLQPQLVRIFFNKGAFSDPDRMQSFVRTSQLAQRAGATIDVTWQSTYGPSPEQDMDQFAGVLVDLVRNQGVSNVRWVTVQNEVNSTRISMDQYARTIRRLDADLRTAGVRDRIRFMGGDLVGTTSPLGQSQRDWFDFMATQLSDVVDAYGIHVFWDYWDTPKLARRLTEVRAIVDALPETGRKPIYVTEYGVRGRPGSSFAGGAWDDGSPFQATNVNAFQVAWLDVLAAQLGYAGTIKWDAYLAKYDNGTQDYSVIGGPLEGWPLRPAYHLLRLFTQTTRPGWSVLGVDAPADRRLVTAYRGSAGELTLIGLNTDGALLNTVSPIPISYSIGGVQAGASFRLLFWNLSGDGLETENAVVTADADGVVTVTAPLHAVFALTTVAPVPRR